MGPKISGVGILMAVFTVGSGTSADGATYRTTWEFHVAYGESSLTQDDTDATISGPVIMPAGSVWSCRRKAASIYSDGTLNAGYTCESGVGVVVIVAGCKAAGESTDMMQVVLFNRNSARGDGYFGNGVGFTARCQTTRATPTPALAKAPGTKL
jgi:hypothetical protein